jgi:hypothetical protein
MARMPAKDVSERAPKRMTRSCGIIMTTTTTMMMMMNDDDLDSWRSQTMIQDTDAVDDEGDEAN